MGIDIRAMKEDMKQYSLPSQWFSDKYEEILDTCYEVATNLPAKLDKQNIIEGDFGTVNLGRIKSFMGCCDKAKMKLCMHQDIKTKIETNFGPVDEILASFNNQLSGTTCLPWCTSCCRGMRTSTECNVCSC